METRHLEIYVTLVDEGSFTKAAQKLFISQPALSQQIGRLEKDMGAVLIDRSARPLKQTALGRRFYVQCTKVLESVREVEAMFQDGHQGRVGRLRIGLTPSLRYGRMPSVVKAHIDAFPNVEAELHFEPTRRLVEMLESGQVDVALMLTEPDLDELTSHRLFSDPYVIAVPTDHPLASMEEVTFRQLRGEKLISIPRVNAPENYDALVAGCLQAGFSMKGPVVTGSYLDHVSLTSAGIGLSFVPQSVAKLDMENIVYKALVEPTVFADVHICWFPDRSGSVTEAFVEHCFAMLGEKEDVEIAAI